MQTLSRKEARLAHQEVQMPKTRTTPHILPIPQKTRTLNCLLIQYMVPPQTPE